MKHKDTPYLKQVKIGLKLIAKAQARAYAKFRLLDQTCDCAGFKNGNGLWFDSQDLYEGRYTKCPACKKPFKQIRRELRKKGKG